MSKKTIVVLSGAGLDAESGIKTFRAEDGTWANVDINEVCTPTAWNTNPTRVNDFYNERRIEMLNSTPNKAHTDLAKAEEEFNIVHLTQNVSDLLERAGCSKVVHLHGEILKARSSNPSIDLHGDPTRLDLKAYRQYPVGKEGLNLNSTAADGWSLRPDIVFFGESVPKFSEAVYHLQKADALIVVGTSLVVEPVASLVNYCMERDMIWYVDPNANLDDSYGTPFRLIRAKASEGIEMALKQVKGLVGE